MLLLLLLLYYCTTLEYHDYYYLEYHVFLGDSDVRYMLWVVGLWTLDSGET